MNEGVPYGLIEDGALAVRDDTIVWLGPRSEMPSFYDSPEVHDVDGRCITPGFVDPHTHVVYAGDRAREFELRLAGAGYAEIARSGGGILSTVRDTRAASAAELAAAADRRVAAMCREGTTTLEVKSGYGLDRETELRMLRVARELSARHRVRVRTTYLGLHALPPERSHSEDYVNFVCEEVLPAVAAEGLADAVDAFCETIAFAPEQVARFFAAARTLGLPVKLHADQLSAGGGGALAAQFGALSADHLEHSQPEDLAALARAGTVAVLLPGAAYFLRERNLPPVAGLRAAGVPIALGTDCNPGTSPLVSPLLAMNLACIVFGLTPEEALRGFTANAARALGLAETVGTLAPGRKADFVVWDVERPVQLAYAMGTNPGCSVVVGGRTEG
ncbi:MAG TPA: imidazolonepropionase [Candidatus Baltobacteraceae bacterium]|nr:imidazolonepropionase [Candidatus Baltobacteraceae bacterium]